ncbi:dihydroorotase [Pseudobutyrivibrio sp. 49]|uniref:dihydroorotase n=1 Tax=Pseudobutyrivibrio sp. 49 TaxID=1855344 RepID=UPI0008838F88|nr:dihydroorotase [Pseudobutyrivibrio sp. 49]SDI36458.1 dihydroorotase [Pseudobutyrivibrio sp. 49]
MSLIIKNGRVLNPPTNTDEILDIKIDGNIISAVEAEIVPVSFDEVIDAAGCYVMPGFIDMHVHFRDPGQTAKEDIETGSKAAARGGVTTVLAMPNTKPVVDNPELVKYVHDKGAKVGLTRVLQVGSVTKGMEGKELSDLQGMIDAGIPAISEDGKSVMDSGLYREAMKLVATAGVPVLAHCEDINLVQGGVMNMGAKSDAMGEKGISNAVENIIEARDIMLAEETGATLHLCHCSTKESYQILKEAKEAGIKVSGEVCPHHFTLTEDDIVPGDGNYKMNPPVRTKEDREFLRRGLAEGVFEVISTDHAPHTAEEKAKGFASPFGIVGLETSASLTYTELVLSGLITPLTMAAYMSSNPARILGRDDLGNLAPGKAADITIFDPTISYEIHAADFVGKSKNMPYEGRKVQGKVVKTIYGGRVVYYDSEAN